MSSQNPKPESDVEQLFGPLSLVFGLTLVYAGAATVNPWALLGGILLLLLSAVFFFMWYDIWKHPEKWRSAL